MADFSQTYSGIDGPTLIGTEQVLLNFAPSLVPVVQNIRNAGAIDAPRTGDGRNSEFRWYPMTLPLETIDQILEALYLAAEESNHNAGAVAALISKWMNIRSEVHQYGASAGTF